MLDETPKRQSPGLLSPIWREWLAAGCLVLLAIACFARQPLVTHKNGLFLDAEQYYLIAERSAETGPIFGPAPLVYRIGLPWLIGRFAGDDIVNGFKLANLFFGLGALIFFFLLLQHLFKERWVVLLLGILFISSPASPFRFNAYYPVMTDPPLLFFSSLIFYVHFRSEKYGWKTIMALSVSSFLGVIFREVTLLAPVAICAAYLLANLGRGINSPGALPRSSQRILPVLAGLFALFLTHRFIRNTFHYSYGGQALQLLEFHWQNPLPYLLSPLSTYGPVLLLAITFAGTSTWNFLKRYPSLPLYALGVLFLALIGGFHGTRLMFWGYVALLPMIGAVLTEIDERYPAYCKTLLLVPIGLAQLLAQNPLGLLPEYIDPPAPEFPGFYLLFPYGNGAHFAQTSPHMMASGLRLQMLLQYLVITAYLVLFRTAAGWLLSRPKLKNPAH